MFDLPEEYYARLTDEERASVDRIRRLACIQGKCIETVFYGMLVGLIVILYLILSGHWGVVPHSLITR